MNIWGGMKARCYSDNHVNYKNYGGRGITICDEWLDSFPAFAVWAITNGYEESLSIDRIRNNGSYNPRNCKWSTSVEQGNNRRTNIVVRISSIEKTIAQWADIVGVPRSTMYLRYKKGIRGQKLLSKSLMNSGSGERYVYLHPKNGKIQFKVAIKTYNPTKTVYLGVHETLDEAIVLRDNYLKGRGNCESK
jgi:hypothetical protein